MNLSATLCGALKNWKTTASSVFTAASGYIAMFPEDFTTHPRLVHLSKYFALGGLVSLGLVARDSKAVCPTKETNARSGQ